MRIAFFGDVVGRSGRTALVDRLPKLKSRLKLDFIVVNAENAAGGFGVTEKICEEMFDAGADVLSTGNHAYAQRESFTYYEREPRLLRPINYPDSTPGRGSGVYETSDGRRVLVVNVLCQHFMHPVDDPFAACDNAVEAARLGRDVDASIIDVHGEATSEKMAMGHYLDGRASLVVGTHTHVPTADEHIMANGTAYQTDAGMCGDYNSVIGMKREEPLRRFVTKMQSERFDPATGPATICGLYVETDDKTGKATSVEAIRLGGILSQTPEVAGVKVG